MLPMMTDDELASLLGTTDSTCISIYLPGEPTESDEKPRIRFKNLLRRAEEAAEAQAQENDGMAEMIERGRRLLTDDGFWRNRRQGLAVFISPDGLWSYGLPMTVAESVTVSTRFSVKPLMPMFMTNERFYILALSLSGVRLFSCNPYQATEVDLPEVPAGIGDSLRFDDKEYQLQFHTGSAGGSGDRPAMFHGQGVGIDERKDDIRRYFVDVDRGLSSHLSGTDIPLVLAGVDYLLPIFREVTGRKSVVSEAVTGNPDRMGADELHARALPLIRPLQMQKVREAEADYHAQAGLGRTAAGVEAVVPAAAYGRVQTLFVAIDDQRPGYFDSETNRVIRASTDAAHTEDLLERATSDTLKNGGHVYTLTQKEMPDPHAAIAALLRY